MLSIIFSTTPQKSSKKSLAFLLKNQNSQKTLFSLRGVKKISRFLFNNSLLFQSPSSEELGFRPASHLLEPTFFSLENMAEQDRLFNLRLKLKLKLKKTNEEIR